MVSVPHSRASSSIDKIQASLTPGRQSPFRRQPSTNTATSRPGTPSSSPTKSSLLSPARGGSVPLERSSSPIRSFATHNEIGREPVSPSINGLRKEGSLSPLKQTNPLQTSRLQTASPTSKSEINTASPRVRAVSPFEAQSPSTPRTTQQYMKKESAEEAPLKQPVFTSNTASKPTLAKSNGIYSNVPAPLLRSFRESFEVLDPNAKGSLDASSLMPMLEQLGMPNDSKALSDFFPAGRGANINLASYLDMLSAPQTKLSSPQELAAAFGAFDIDDSGQVDVAELREAVLKTLPEPNEANPGARLRESELDGLLQDFVGRRAFGSKSLGASKSSNARGDVFRWREFVGSLSGGVEENAQPVAV